MEELSVPEGLGDAIWRQIAIYIPNRRITTIFLIVVSCAKCDIDSGLYRPPIPGHV
jgi:hypothetical protein